MYTSNDYKIIFGRSTDVRKIIAIVRNGRCQVIEYISGLENNDRKRIIAVMSEMAEKGQIKNKQKFKPLSDKIFEFKSDLNRIFCFYFKYMLVCTHGTIKPKNKGYKSEIAKAKKLRAHFINL